MSESLPTTRLNQEDRKEIFIQNARYWTVMTGSLAGVTSTGPIIPPPFIPPPIATQSGQPDRLKTYQGWYLKKVAGELNVYTIQNAKTWLYATVGENPSAGDTVVEGGTPRMWKVSAGALSAWSSVQITPTGPQQNILYWSLASDPSADPNGYTEQSVTLEKDPTTARAAWTMNYTRQSTNDSAEITAVTDQ